MIYQKLIATFCLFLIPLAVRASADYDDDYFKDRFDFVAILTIKQLEEMTNYKNSTLKPIGQISVSYRANSRTSKNRHLESTPYEDLWYHDLTPIGCRRYRDMPAECTGFGAIKVLSSADANSFAGALANASIRLMMDMNLHGCACQNIILPKEIFYSVFYNFAQFGFYEVKTKPETPIPGSITLTLMSDPPGEVRRVYFHEPHPSE